VNGRRLLSIVALALGLTAGLAGVIPRLLWPAPGVAARAIRDRSEGEIAGYVARVDLAGRRVEIAANALGFHPIEVKLTDETTIVVHGKQGGPGDLWVDMPVRVSYEVRDNVHVAKSILVATADGREGNVSAATRSAPAPPPAPVTPAVRETSRAVKPAMPAAAAPPIPDTGMRAPLDRANTGVATPRASAQATAPSVARSRPSRAEPSGRRGASAATPSADAAAPVRQTPASRDAGDDGTAAIDWLLKQSGR